MRKDVLLINTLREGYGIDQIKKTMTVGELISYLEDYDEETEIYLAFDNRYTYGGIVRNRFEDELYDDETEEFT